MIDGYNMQEKIVVFKRDDKSMHCKCHVWKKVGTHQRQLTKKKGTHQRRKKMKRNLP